jgi:hypothetical protein
MCCSLSLALSLFLSYCMCVCARVCVWVCSHTAAQQNSGTAAQVFASHQPPAYRTSIPAGACLCIGSPTNIPAAAYPKNRTRLCGPQSHNCRPTATLCVCPKRRLAVLAIYDRIGGRGSGAVQPSWSVLCCLLIIRSFMDISIPNTNVGAIYATCEDEKL